MSGRLRAAPGAKSAAAGVCVLSAVHGRSASRPGCAALADAALCAQSMPCQPQSHWQYPLWHSPRPLQLLRQNCRVEGWVGWGGGCQEGCSEAAQPGQCRCGEQTGGNQNRRSLKKSGDPGRTISYRVSHSSPPQPAPQQRCISSRRHRGARQRRPAPATAVQRRHPPTIEVALAAVAWLLCHAPAIGPPQVCGRHGAPARGPPVGQRVGLAPQAHGAAALLRRAAQGRVLTGGYPAVGGVRGAVAGRHLVFALAWMGGWVGGEAQGGVASGAGSALPRDSSQRGVAECQAALPPTRLRSGCKAASRSRRLLPLMGLRARVAPRIHGTGSGACTAAAWGAGS